MSLNTLLIVKDSHTPFNNIVKGLDDKIEFAF